MVERLAPGLVLETALQPPPRQVSEMPAALLLAEYELGPFEPRPELDEVADWHRDPAGSSVTLLTGGLGEGKTRLALELCRRLRRAGHPAGLFSPAAQAGALERLADLSRDTLLVIDDAETRVEQVRAALLAISGREDN